LLPLHPVCSHGQSASRASSPDSHAVLQYLPEETKHVHAGCVHASCLAILISRFLV
jgi:hypothetical protein